MGLVVVHDSHGEVARIIPPGHDVWERLVNPIWYFRRFRTGREAKDNWVPYLRAIMRRVNVASDGPCGYCRWRHNGKITEVTMQGAAWRMCGHLWEQPDRTATFNALKVPVYGDREHIADDNAYGSLRREANKAFGASDIPWRAGLKKGTAYLKLAK